jgi:hypothetical protein
MLYPEVDSTCPIYKAIAKPKNPTAPRIPAATTPVGAAPALLELVGAAELEDFVVTTTAEAVGALDVVAIVLLEYEVVLALLVDTAVPVPTPEMVVRPAATSSETISGTMVAAFPATPRT